MRCTKCNGIMREHESKTPENVTYYYYRCNNCGEEIVNMKQLHSVAEQYRNLNKYKVKLSKWGLSLGMRIPKELIKEYGLKEDTTLTIIPEKKSMKIIPQ